MITKKAAGLEIDYLATLKTIMETYEEIAASRMQKIRSSVLQSRDFLLEINYIFSQVKSSYKNEIAKLLKQKKTRQLNKLRFINHNGKKLFVLLSANTGLYGNIVRRTFDLFSLELKKEKCDVAIIGKVGLEFFQEEFPNMALRYFEIPDDKADPQIFKTIVAHFIQYETVFVFYEQFQNVIAQQPVVTSISGDRLPTDVLENSIKYFFEPSLSTIMEFFEKQIFSSIFDQTIYESRLAKYASRMVALNSAADNTNSKLKEMLLVKERIRHHEINKKQVEVLSSQVLWQK